jgi:uncharacterized protein
MVAELRNADDQVEVSNPPSSKRGFAPMSHDRQVEIARKGGASVPDEKRSFFQDRALAAAAGRKGGKASHVVRSGAAPLPS